MRIQSRGASLFIFTLFIAMQGSGLIANPPADELGSSFRISDSDAAQRQGDEKAMVDESQPAAVDRAVQVGFPENLILKPPTEDALSIANRFVQSTIDPEIPLNLVLGRPKILQLSAVPRRLYVPDEDVVRTEVIDRDSGREIAVTGLREGSTTLIMWFDDANSPSGQTTVSYLVRVYADPILARPIESLEKELNLKFPNSFIELDQIEDRMIVRGQAPDTIEMAQILQVLTGARGINPIQARASRNRNQGSSITLTNAANFQEQVDTAMLDDVAAQRRRVIDPIALAQAGIINQMTVVGEQQVMLKVTVAEVNRSAARSIGLNFGIQNDGGFTVFESAVGNLTTQGGSGANLLASLDMGQVQLAIEALRRLNLSKTLAEPNLVTMNGQPADFHAGGRFPVPIISAGGNGNGQNLQGVSFIPFGVELQFTPIIEDRDIIRLQLNAEVSTRDESLGTSIGGGAGGGAGGGGGGTQVSGLNSRNFSTTVQLRSGQTIAVAGLLQTNYGASADRVPFWGDLPFVGASGGVSRSSSGEQELVILVTPHLVAPTDEGRSRALPGSDVYEPSDLEFFVANRLESRRSKDYRSSVRTDHARQKITHKSRSEQFMLGEIGPTDRPTPVSGTKPHSPVRQLQKKVVEGVPPPVIVSEELIPRVPDN